MFKLVVAGSRSFADEGRLFADLDRLLARRLPAVEIVTGGCPSGADAIGARYARARGLPLRVFPARWAKLGRAAGPVRNEEMALYADGVIVYWDGESRGSKSMINSAVAHGVRVVIRRF